MGTTRSAIDTIEELKPKHVTQLQRLAPRAVAPAAAAAVPSKVSRTVSALRVPAVRKAPTQA